MLNATVLTASGQPIQLAQSSLGGPQKLIVTQHTPGGQPRLIVPAQLLSNGPSAVPNRDGTGHEMKKEGSETSELINPGRQILASQQLSLFPTSTLTERIETHKIISTPIGVSGTPIILQTAGALTSLQP